MRQFTFAQYLVFSLLLLAAGCQRPEPEQPSAQSHILRAYLEQRSATKSQLGVTEDNRYYAFWSAKDQIAVYVDGLSTPDRYALTEGAGTEKGVFVGVVSGSRYVGLYPYNDRTPEGLKDNVLTLELPADQMFAEGSFGEGAFPMLAVGDGDDLSFKNLCSVLKVSMTGEVSVKAVRFVAHDTTMAVSGRATVRTDYSAAPSLVMAEGGSPRVTLQCSSVILNEYEPVDFFLVIPPGTYRGGFSIEVETFAGIFERSVTSDVTFARSEIRYIAPFVCEANGEIDPDDIPHNQIWYVTENNRPYSPRENSFDANIVSNTYVDGKYVLTFDGVVTEVGSRVFTSNNITEIRLPNSVRSIGERAFMGTRITSFRTPDQLASVGESIFDGCSEIRRIYGQWASADGTALVLKDGTMVARTPCGEEYTIPAEVVKLTGGLFAGDRNLRHVTLSPGVKEIGSYCFNDCEQLETITFSGDVKMNKFAIFECKSLRKLEGECAGLLSDRCLVDEKGYVLACAGAGIEDYVFPEGVVTIDYFRLYESEDVRSVTFPSSLRSLNAEFSLRCNNLEFFYGPNTSEDHHCYVRNGILQAITLVLPSTYTLPDEVESISNYVFVRNKTIQRLVLPDKITSMGYRQFREASALQTIVMSASLESIGFDSFEDCPALDTLYFRSYSPPSYEERYDDLFDLEDLVIYVPEETMHLYLNSPNWQKYSAYIQGYHYDDLSGEMPDYYISSDYSHDGEVTVLQTASEGRGIDIVLLGDAYSDRQIADGTYATVMNKMAEAFFSEEPYKSYRNLFNVYAVNAVSMTEGYEHGGAAFSGYFGDGTHVGGNDGKCMDYALRVVPEDRMDDALIIVAMNSPRYAGTCYMYGSSSSGDYGSGTSVAYFPVGESDEGLAQLVHHEAGGHGFAKLADEYAYEDMGRISSEEIAGYQTEGLKGWWKNVDFTPDPETVKWSYFLKDSRYQYDGLGIFEGACTYWTGAYRPTENSIMRYNTGGYNAPSREAIWYRIHKLAYGDAWTYDYESFVAYDALNRKTDASSAGAWNPARQSAGRPTAAPVVVGKTWREVYGRQD